MYPHERSLVRQLADFPFAIVGVNSDKDRDKIQAKMAEENITWQSFWNGPDGTRGPISTKWNVSAWPTTYLIDAEGVIRYTRVRGAKLNESIETLLAELGHEVKIEEPNEFDEDPSLSPDEPEDDSEEKSDEDAEGESSDESTEDKAEKAA